MLLNRFQIRQQSENSEFIPVKIGVEMGGGVMVLVAFGFIPKGGEEAAKQKVANEYSVSTTKVIVDKIREHDLYIMLPNKAPVWTSV